ncbi:alanyl-tRNA synthetase [Aphelenchoides avenae]|nr:alanyl-tRNA synthetase [Aphelenchus avenae]
MLLQLSPLPRKYEGHVGPLDRDGVDTAYRILADHLRSIAVISVEGIKPSDGANARGFLLRKLIRRVCLLSTQTLQVERFRLADVLATVIEHLKDAYPEFEQKRDLILSTFEKEERRFWYSGEKKFYAMLASLHKEVVEGSIVFPGPMAYRLYYEDGYPLDLIQRYAEKHGMTVDVDGFNRREKEVTEYNKCDEAAAAARAQA